MMKKIISILAVALLVSSVCAQTDRMQLGVNVGGGLNTMLYKVQDGQQKLGGGATFDVNFRYFFNDNWGIGTAVGISSYAAKGIFNSELRDSRYDEVNMRNYEYIARADNWQERQNMILFELPIGVYYRTEIANKWNFMAGLGVRLDVPVWSNYMVKDGSYSLSAYYPDLGVEFNNMPQHGLYTQTESLKGKNQLRTVDAQVFADLGFTYNVSNALGLYMGLYAAYGLTNQLQPGADKLFLADNYQGMFQSTQVDAMHNLSFGVKLGCVVNLGK